MKKLLLPIIALSMLSPAIATDEPCPRYEDGYILHHPDTKIIDVKPSTPADLVLVIYEKPQYYKIYKHFKLIYFAPARGQITFLPTDKYCKVKK